MGMVPELTGHITGTRDGHACLCVESSEAFLVAE